MKKMGVKMSQYPGTILQNVRALIFPEFPQYLYGVYEKVN